MGSPGFERAMAAMSRGPLRPTPDDGRKIVLLHGPWRRPDDGWSIANRANARMMEMAGLDVRLFDDVLGTPVDPEVIDVAEKYARLSDRWDAHIFSAALFGAEKIVPYLSHLPLDKERQIFHAMFERFFIEPEIAAELNKLHGTWSQCSSNDEVLKAAGVTNSMLIRFPFFDDDPHLTIPPPIECKKFYWIGRFEPRKAPDNLIRAFMRAFRPGEAALTLKLSAYAGPQNSIYITPEETIIGELQTNKNGWSWHEVNRWIRMIKGRISKQEMLRLHVENDCYVSAARGEGIELGSFAAKLAGRMLVVTDSGGPRDFLSDGDVMVPMSGLLPVPEEYDHGGGATYADYKLDDLVAALQLARASTPAGSRVPAPHRAENVARCFKEWVGGILG